MSDETQNDMARPTDPALVSDQAASHLAPSGFDPSRSIYRSQDYAMCTIDQGRDSDGAPLSEVWTFAGEDDGVEGYGHLVVRVHEVIQTQASGTLAVYYRHWIAPDGGLAWGKSPKRVVGSLGSLKALIRRRKMSPCDSDQNPKGGNEVPSRSDASADPKGIAQGGEA